MKHIVYIEIMDDSPILESSRHQDGATMIPTIPMSHRDGQNRMAKSYNEQLAEWIRQRAQSARHERNRVAFLSVKDDVREAIEQGWPVKTIWAHMVEQKRIEFGYDTFLVYVKRLVRPAAEPAVARKSKVPRRPPLTPVSPLPAGSAESRTPSASVQDQLPGFTFNVAPNREELI
ncbi:MAG: TraK family protein [Massilia sp.]